MADAAPPKRLGKYRPIKKLGAGGMGVVYLAETPNWAAPSR